MGSVAGLPAKRAAAVLFCGRLVSFVKNDYNIEPVTFADFFTIATIAGRSALKRFL
jgi:hypothetical protein